MLESMKKFIAAHSQKESHSYVIHFPAHPPREGDPHYRDFHQYHKTHRATARCYIGERIGFSTCKDEHGVPCPPPRRGGLQPGLELHHDHIEFALENGISLVALEKDYPGVSNPDEIGAWVESGANFRWLCCYHHRAEAGAHTASHSDWEGSQYVLGLL